MSDNTCNMDRSLLDLLGMVPYAHDDDDDDLKDKKPQVNTFLLLASERHRYTQSDRHEVQDHHGIDHNFSASLWIQRKAKTVPWSQG